MKKVKRYLFPADYMADPSVHVYNDRVYIYPSHDWECNNVNNDSGDEYIMKDYHVLSTDDPMNGEVIDHGKVLDLEDIAWRGRQLWDCDVAEKDGKYYLDTNVYDFVKDFTSRMINTDVLGMAFEPEQKFENPDETPIQFDRDYFGNHRGASIIPGPFACVEDSKKAL